jgi:hypothetical protein
VIEQILFGIISFIGVAYAFYLFLCEMTWKQFIVLTSMAFVMVIIVLLLGKFMFGVW